MGSWPLGTRYIRSSLGTKETLWTLYYLALNSKTTLTLALKTPWPLPRPLSSRPQSEDPSYWEPGPKACETLHYHQKLWLVKYLDFCRVFKVFFMGVMHYFWIFIYNIQWILSTSLSALQTKCAKVLVLLYGLWHLAWGSSTRNIGEIWVGSAFRYMWLFFLTYDTKLMEWCMAWKELAGRDRWINLC